MKIAITTLGTRGDFQPYLALSRAFLQAGHDVRLGAPRVAEFAAAAAELGVSYAPLGPEEPYRGTAFRNLLDRTSRMHDVFHQLQASIDEFTAPWLDQMYSECLSLGAWADVLVSHFFQPAGKLAADSLGCPFVTGAPTDVCIPSEYFPPPGVPDFGRWSNRLLWRLVSARANSAWLGGLNRRRQKIGLPPVRDVAREGVYSDDLNLIFVSRHVAPRPPDWSPAHHVTGYWFLDRTDWTPPADLAEFVTAQPRPIAIGFGSMAAGDDDELTHMLIEAVDRAGARAVLLSGWAGLGDAGLPSSVFAAGDVPHDWLFPRVAAVVHHGGAGTTAAAFRAGVPSVMVPHHVDQQPWADRAAKLGVAPRPIPRRSLTADRLARAIRIAIRDQAMQTRAERLGAAIREEDGLGTAVRLVEEYVERTVPRGQASRS